MGTADRVREQERRQRGRRTAGRGGRRPGRAELGPAEKRRLLQLAVCLALFLAVFVGRGVFPQRMEQLRVEILAAIHGDTDFRAAFSALGQAVSEGKPFTQAMAALWGVEAGPSEGEGEPLYAHQAALLSGLIPILTLLSLSLLLSRLSLQSLRLRNLICGTPAILIQNGTLRQDVMRKNRLTLDELLEELREQGITRIEDVKYAVLENSGSLSVLPWTAQQPPTAAQLGLDLEDSVTLPVMLIKDGRILKENLRSCGRDQNWLEQQLRHHGLSSPRQAFLLTLDEQGAVFCIKKEL